MSRLDLAFLARPIAHRGLHDQGKTCWENSRTAFARSIELGLPIECDVQCSSDGKAVVFHDETLDRVTSASGLIAARFADELTQITLGQTEDRIQTLPELLAQVGGRVPLLIEIKDQSGELGPELGGFMSDIVTNLSAYQGALAVMSFSPYPIAYLRERMTDACLGLVTDDFLCEDWDYLPRERAQRLTEINEIPQIELDFISHHWIDLERVRDIQLPKLCWTVKSASDEIGARKIADNITFEQYMPAFK